MIKNILAATAIASLAIAPLAAMANTRAANSGVQMRALGSLQRTSSPIGLFESQDEGGFPTEAVVGLFGAAGLGLILAVEETENKKSPGTN